MSSLSVIVAGEMNNWQLSQGHFALIDVLPGRDNTLLKTHQRRKGKRCMHQVFAQLLEFPLEITSAIFMWKNSRRFFQGIIVSTPGHINIMRATN